MQTEQRLNRLETIALNQTLIIRHLSALVRSLAADADMEAMLEASAEDMLDLVYGEGLQLESLRMASEWRERIARPVMLTS